MARHLSSRPSDASLSTGYDHVARPWIVVALVAVGVAVVTGMVASSGDVPGWEARIFHWINDLPDWLRAPMWVFQLAGLLLAPLAVAIGAAAARRWRLAASLVVLDPTQAADREGGRQAARGAAAARHLDL